jgi:hypothetical protein
MIGLDSVGFLDPFNTLSARPAVLEIGSGWGGFAYTFKKIFSAATYICVDLPPTLLFSATYLATLFPDARCLIYGEKGFDSGLETIEDYDFVFIPHFKFDIINQIKIELALNMVSFQEMTQSQVDSYVRMLRTYSCPRLYSLNRDRSKHNQQINSVSEIIADHYKTEIVELLDLQYVNLKPLKTPKVVTTPFDYRHVAGRLR